MNKFKRDQIVNFHIQGKTIGFCKITAVKDCETGYRYDFVVDGVKMYDISQDLLTDLAEEVIEGIMKQQF